MEDDPFKECAEAIFKDEKGLKYATANNARTRDKSGGGHVRKKKL